MTSGATQGFAVGEALARSCRGSRLGWRSRSRERVQAGAIPVVGSGSRHGRACNAHASTSERSDDLNTEFDVVANGAKHRRRARVEAAARHVVGLRREHRRRGRRRGRPVPHQAMARRVRRTAASHGKGPCGVVWPDCCVCPQATASDGGVGLDIVTGLGKSGHSVGADLMSAFRAEQRPRRGVPGGRWSGDAATRPEAWRHTVGQRPRRTAFRRRAGGSRREG